VLLQNTVANCSLLCYCSDCKEFQNAGTKKGMQIWRIQNLAVVPVPVPTYGSFYDGDSYICLYTYTEKNSETLKWNIHFWIGKHSSIDEQCVAAYKTVELDDKLSGGPIEYREVQGEESPLFLSYFNNLITILNGGFDSGFHITRAETYQPRLVQIKGKKHVRATETVCSGESLNSGDVFICDKGLKLMIWTGKKGRSNEKFKAIQVCNDIKSSRNGRPIVQQFNEGDEPDEFWQALGGKPARIKTAEEGGQDEQVDKEMANESNDSKLFEVCDDSGSTKLTLVAEGGFKKGMLNPGNCFIMDVGKVVYVWIGSGSSANEQKMVYVFAGHYLKDHAKPAATKVEKIMEGSEPQDFLAHFH